MFRTLLYYLPNWFTINTLKILSRFICSFFLYFSVCFFTFDISKGSQTAHCHLTTESSVTCGTAILLNILPKNLRHDKQIFYLMITQRTVSIKGTFLFFAGWGILLSTDGSFSGAAGHLHVQGMEIIQPNLIYTLEKGKSLS